MSALETTLRHILDSLTRRRVRVALVRGLAVSVRAEPRFTSDADLAVIVASDAEAEALVASLAADGYRAIAAVEHDRLQRLATIRLVDATAADHVVVDLLFASSGIEPEIVEAADELDVIPGLTVRVASVGHLIAMKLLARDDRRRPADADDLAALCRVATDTDWNAAAAAARLITERHGHRNRDLVGAVELLRSGVSPFDMPTPPT